MHCLVLVDDQSIWSSQDPMSISEWQEFLENENVLFTKVRPMNFGPAQNSNNHRRFNDES